VTDLRITGNIVLYLTTIGAVLAVAIYSQRPWRSGIVGRQAMAGMVALASVLLVISVRNLIGPFPFYPHLRLIAFTSVGVTVWTQVLVLIYVQRHAGTSRQSKETPMSGLGNNRDSGTPTWLKWGSEAKKLGAAVGGGLAMAISSGFVPEPYNTYAVSALALLTMFGVYKLKNEPAK
jgi:hypothetical protein